MDRTVGPETHQGEWSLLWFSAKLDIVVPTTQTEWLPRPDLRGFRVLCINDNPTNLFLLESSSKTWGTEVTTTPIPQCPSFKKPSRRGNPLISPLSTAACLNWTSSNRVNSSETMQTYQTSALTSIGQRGEAETAHHACFAGDLTKPLHGVQLHDGLATVMGYSVADEPNKLRSLITRHTVKEPQRDYRDKILVADDHAITQQLIVLLLECLGYRSEVVGNRWETIQAVASGLYALVLMDCHMPKMDGFVATKNIREAESEKYKTLDVKDKMPEGTLPYAVPLTAHFACPLLP